jgi:hypothetical protein
MSFFVLVAVLLALMWSGKTCPRCGHRKGFAVGVVERPLDPPCYGGCAFDSSGGGSMGRLPRPHYHRWQWQCPNCQQWVDPPGTQGSRS